MTSRIIGTGSYVPEHSFTNTDMEKLVDTSDEWIAGRTGIRSRRLAKEETTSFMAAEAGRLALEDSQMDASELELIIVATCSAEEVMPNTACRVQQELQAVHAVGFDLNAACSGFLFALHTAHAYLRAGICKNALVLGAESLSRLLDWTDRSTCVLFGDGAGAVVLRQEETGILGLSQFADGSRGDVLTCGNSQNGNPLQETKESHPGKIAMDGQEVFKFAVRQVPACITDLLNHYGCGKDEIRYFILHQANARIIRSVAKRLDVPEAQFPMNMEQYGNTSAASIPMLLDELNRGGCLKKGDHLVLSGFGAGLTWGACLLMW